MKYNKPEVSTMAEAVRGVHSQLVKTLPFPPESPTFPFTAPPAYEADE